MPSLRAVCPDLFFRRRSFSGLLVVVSLFLQSVCLECSTAQTLPLPARPVNAPDREQIIRILTPLSRQAREDTLFRLIMSGNVPQFMRTLVPVTSSASIGGAATSVTFYVTPDYFAVGPDDRYFLIPMTPLLAQRLADALQCTLPTRKMVNDIYAGAQLKLAPAPIPPSAQMITVPVFAQHDSMVWTQRSPQLSAFPPGTLVGGTKKDVVISNKIRNDLKAGVPRPVVIYGWHQLNGVPIQPLYNGHEETYADYSHGTRLVQQAVQLNGSPTTVSAILQDASLSVILSDEGPIPFPRYGDPPVGVEEERSGSGPMPGRPNCSVRAMPNSSMLAQNFPNPFNPTTDIGFHVEEAGAVTLVVYDLLGHEVALLVNERKAPGNYAVNFDARGLSAGVYFYRLTAERIIQTGKMVVVK